MDVRFINPFIGSVKNVFKTMLTTDIIVSKPVIKEHDEANADVSAVIGLSGDASGVRGPVLSHADRGGGRKQVRRGGDG